jgi:hypothetical protein
MLMTQETKKDEKLPIVYDSAGNPRAADDETLL